MEWTGQVYADCPAVAAEIYIEAPPERVWPFVSDIFLMPRLSAELQEVAWLGPGGPAAGCRFTGRNANQALGEWETVSTVIECDPPRRFAWAVGDPAHPSATWRFTLRPEGQGTTLEQWTQMGPGRSGLNLAIDAMPDKEQKIVFARSIVETWEGYPNAYTVAQPRRPRRHDPGVRPAWPRSAARPNPPAP